MKAYALSYPVTLPASVTASVEDFGGEARPVLGGELYAYAAVEVADGVTLSDLDAHDLYCPELEGTLNTEARWNVKQFFEHGRDWQLLARMNGESCKRHHVLPERLASRVHDVFSATRAVRSDVPGDSDLAAHGIVSARSSELESAAGLIARDYSESGRDRGVLRSALASASASLGESLTRLSVSVHESFMPSCFTCTFMTAS